MKFSALNCQFLPEAVVYLAHLRRVGRITLRQGIPYRRLGVKVVSDVQRDSPPTAAVGSFIFKSDKAIDRRAMKFQDCTLHAGAPKRGEGLQPPTCCAARSAMLARSRVYRSTIRDLVEWPSNAAASVSELVA